MKPNVSPTAARAALVAFLIAALATIASAQTAPTFTVKGPSEVGDTNPRYAVAADFTGDGRLDLIVTTSQQLAGGGTGRVNLLANNGDGLFAAAQTINLPLAGGVAGADFNADGTLDLAVTTGGAAQCSGSGVAIYLASSTAPGGFAFRTCLTGIPSVSAVQAGNFNSDAFPDLAVVSSAGFAAGLRIFHGSGTGTFTLAQTVNSSQVPAQDMTAADLNRDGKVDLVIAAAGGFRAFLASNTGNGTFEIAPTTQPGGNTVAVVAGDVTGDGIADIVEVYAGQAPPGGVAPVDRFRIDRGIGNGAFLIGADQVVGPGLQDVALTDINADGRLDLVLVGGNPGTRVLLNDGSGTFSPTVVPQAVPDPGRVAAGDWNGDGLSDIAIVGPRSANAQVFVALQNFVDRIAPTVDILTPADGSTVRGIVAIRATAADNVGVTRVDFFANGEPIGSSAGPDFTANWDTSALLGNFTIAAKAFDAAGNTTEDSVFVVVADQVNPTVNITAPAAGNVSGIVTVSATAADNVGVAKVDFFANDMLIGSSNGPAYTVSWNASALAGNFTIRARAFDAAGNFADASVSVTVLDIAKPSAPTNLTGRSLDNFHFVLLNWTASTDNAGVAHYRVYELVRGSSNAMVWQLVRNGVDLTRAIAEIDGRRGQAHTFGVTAVDAAGNESERAVVAVSRDSQ
jgi:hypothetical protein